MQTMALSEEAKALKEDLMVIVSGYVGQDKTLQEELLYELFDRMRESDGDPLFELIVS